MKIELETSYKNHKIKIYEPNKEGEKYCFRISIHAPFNVDHIEATTFEHCFGCKTKDEAIILAQKYAISFIEKRFL